MNVDFKHLFTFTFNIVAQGHFYTNGADGIGDAALDEG